MFVSTRGDVDAEFYLIQTSNLKGTKQRNRNHEHEIRSLNHTCFRRRSRQGVLRETGVSPRSDYTANEDFRVLQFTPPASEASIIFGKGITSAQRGSADSLILAVDDVEAARKDLIARGVEVSEVFHYAGGPFNNAVKHPRLSGRDPEGRSYFSFASFEDPDGNGWLLQEITTRLPGREWKTTQKQSLTLQPSPSSCARRSEHHGPYEKTHADHQLVGLVRALPARAPGRQQVRRNLRPRPPTATWTRCVTFLLDEGDQVIKSGEKSARYFYDRVIVLNLLANTAIFYVAARLYLLPLVSRLRPRQILVPILLLHSMRHLGMMFLTRGATLPGLPPEFAYPAAFGDLNHCRPWPFAAIPLVLARQWPRQAGGVDASTVFGTLDLLAAITTATVYNAPPAMGPAYWIPALWVPLLSLTSLRGSCSSSTGLAFSGRIGSRRFLRTLPNS